MDSSNSQTHESSLWFDIIKILYIAQSSLVDNQHFQLMLRIEFLSTSSEIARRYMTENPSD